MNQPDKQYGVFRLSSDHEVHGGNGQIILVGEWTETSPNLPTIEFLGTFKAGNQFLAAQTAINQFIKNP